MSLGGKGHSLFFKAERETERERERERRERERDGERERGRERERERLYSLYERAIFLYFGRIGHYLLCRIMPPSSP